MFTLSAVGKGRTIFFQWTVTGHMNYLPREGPMTKSGWPTQNKPHGLGGEMEWGDAFVYFF